MRGVSKRRLRWSHAVLALAAIAALAIAAPGFGLGKGIKKAIKKEVRRQVARATGPAGPPGAIGPPGPAGPAGPPGTARAYARVIAHDGFFRSPCDGGVDGNECRVFGSKGVSFVYRVGTGRYCVVAPGIARLTEGTPALSIESSTDHPRGNAGAIIALGGTSPCLGENEFGMITQRQPEVSVRNAADTGTVSVAGNAVDADDVGFTIVIP